MQITINIDPNFPRWLKRVAMYAGVPAFLAVAAAVYADVSVAQFNSGEPLSSTKMNQNFDALRVGVNAAAPPGSIIAFAGSVIPPGWLLCDGSPVPRSQYASLYAAIGTTHGAPDQSTFNLPDYRGRFLRGVDNGAGLDPDATSRGAAKPGGQSGNAVGSVQADAFQVHAHRPTGAAFGSVYSDGYGLFVGATPGNDHLGVLEQVLKGDVAGADKPLLADDIFPSKVGGSPNTSAESRPKNAYVNWIIKY